MVVRGMHPKTAAKIRAEKGIKDTKLQRLRVKQGISQNDLATLTGISKRTLQMYEQGRTAIDGAKLDKLCKICIALNCKLEDILEDEKLIRIFNKSK